MRKAGPRKVFVAHEIMADRVTSDLFRHPARYGYALNHRRQWKALLEAADAVHISTGRWLEDWSARRPDWAPKLSLLPSPTRIAPVAVPAGHAAAWRAQKSLPARAKGVAYFGTLNASKQLPWVIDAWRAAHSAEHPVALAIIGSAPVINLPADLRPWLLPLGYLPADEVSRTLHAVDVLALPFFDGISERRTTLMAGLAHGVAVATTRGHNTGSALWKADFLALSPASAEGEFIRSVVDLVRDADRRAKIAAAGLAACAREYSWPVVVGKLRGPWSRRRTDVSRRPVLDGPARKSSARDPRDLSSGECDRKWRATPAERRFVTGLGRPLGKATGGLPRPPAPVAGRAGWKPALRRLPPLK